MRSPVVLLFFAMFSLLAQNSSQPADWQAWLNRGVTAFKDARYQEAIDAFQRAAELNPNQAIVHAYLGTTYLSQYIPGSPDAANLVHAHDAEVEFKRVLDLDANNLTALQSLASLSYHQASVLSDAQEKARKLAEAQDWNRRLLAVDRRNKEAYYSLGVIAWAQWYPSLMTARSQLGMKPQDPGPLPSPAYRQDLKNKYGQIIEDGIANLQNALEIDPDYADAMAYLNLLLRGRADLRETVTEYKQDVAAAESVAKALTAKRPPLQMRGSFVAAPPPPPPPPDDSSPRIRVSGGMPEKLINRVDPVCPSLAIQARIEGAVRFTVIVGKDGRVQNIQLVSGHPLLVQAARSAVQQWVYRPTLLNGDPVEIVTQADVYLPCGR